MNTENRMNEIVESMKGHLFMTTDMYHGRISFEDEVKRQAEGVYDDVVCGRRIDPADVSRMVELAVLLRGRKVAQ